MDARIVARWRAWSGDGLQHVFMTQRADAIVADGVVLFTDDRLHFAATYRIECDAGWHVTRTHVRLIGVDTAIDVNSDGAGHWRDGGGTRLPMLDGAIDVDISVTPFTNTLPIRRLRLAQGQTADIRAVYVQLPALTVSVDPQRYTCLKPGQQYRYESLDSDFARAIDVDADGLVVTYPGLFKRVV
jgi:uncharacterized protein